MVCENKAVVHIASNPVSIKELAYWVDRQFVQEKLLEKVIRLSYVKLINQLVDFFVKALWDYEYNIFNKLGELISPLFDTYTSHFVFFIFSVCKLMVL